MIDTSSLALLVSITGNVIQFVQLYRARKKEETELRSEIMVSALNSKQLAYSVKVGLVFFLESYSEKIDQERVKVITNSIAYLGAHISGIEELYEIASDTQRSDKSELASMKQSIAKIESDVKDMASLLQQAEKFHSKD